MPRHWQVLLLAALGIGATLIAVPRALSGIVAVPQGGSDPGISRTAGAMQTPKVTATVPGWSPSVAASNPPGADKKPPSLVSNLRITSNTEAVAVVSWDPSSDNVAVRGYVVVADRSTSETSALSVSFPWARHTASFTVKVAAVDTSGNQGEWRTIVVNPPKGATTAQAAVTTAPVDVTTSPSTAAPTETTTAQVTPPPPPPSSELPLVTTSPSQAGVPTDTSSPAAQPSTQPL
ncbi:MAG: hypothetical protein ACOH16_10765 [Propionibacteriaceae bacterium]